MKFGYSWLPDSVAVLADYFCELPESTSHPKAQLVSSAVAIGHLYDSLGLTNFMQDTDIRHLLVALSFLVLIDKDNSYQIK